MKPFHICLSLFLSLCFSQCSSQNKITSPSDGRTIAFPGAEGFGKYTTGGRGGKVIIVSNLDDDGPGSLRKAVSDKEPRIIVFSVSGTIHLKSKLNIFSNCTIAGQSAPGDGICIADKTVILSGDNIIVRFMRFRMGDRYANEGMKDGAGGDDAFGGTRRKNIVIDHCSMSWSEDEVFSVYAGDSTTLQWNMIYEPLNYSYHFEEGDKDFEHHGFGAIWGGRHLSAHHNLFAHCNNRNPRFDGIRNSPEENVDYRNNVIYNWGTNSIYAGEGGRYNIVNNYFKYGPSTKETVKYRIVNPGKTDKIPYGKYFVTGNFVDGAPDVTAMNMLGVVTGKNNEDQYAASVNEPFASVELPSQKATDAYEAVLKFSGASFRRDTLDQRIVNDVKNRTGAFIDVQGNYPHGTPYEKTVNAWPALASFPAPADADGDGMPDEWEKKNGLSPNDPSDASAYDAGTGYTHIEIYLNSLLQHAGKN